MNWIELEYTFPEIDNTVDTYFEDIEGTDDYITQYGFQSIPQMKELLKSRMQGVLSDKEILNIATTTFRNKPEEKLINQDNSDKQPVDFIYQF